MTLPSKIGASLALHHVSIFEYLVRYKFLMPTLASFVG